MGLFSKFRRYDDDELDDELLEEEVGEDTASVSLGGSNIELKVIKPSSFEQLLKAADLLKDGKTILLNLENIEAPLLRRMIDFISGAAYVLHANIKQATSDSYFISPGDVDVSGEIFKRAHDEDTFTDL